MNMCSHFSFFYWKKKKQPNKPRNVEQVSLVGDIQSQLLQKQPICKYKVPNKIK